MTHNIEAIYNHGIFRPLSPLALAEGARVVLHVEEAHRAEQSVETPAEDELPTLLERMKDFVGTVNNLPPDASVNLDHYLYGTPKRQ